MDNNCLLIHIRIVMDFKETDIDIRDLRRPLFGGLFRMLFCITSGPGAERSFNLRIIEEMSCGKER